MEGEMTDAVTRRLNVLRVAATGGLGNALVFVLCWVGTFIPFSSPTHAFIGLFTPEETQSLNALLEGGLWSLLFGAVAGAVFAWLYNLLAGLDR
jgi:hypothetical protein